MIVDLADVEAQRLDYFDHGLSYAYARGYLHGYALGDSEIRPPRLSEAEKVTYKWGYDKGVADYCAEE